MPRVRHCCRKYHDVNEPYAHCRCASDERMIFYIIIPHVNSPYKTSIDEQLIFYNILLIIPLDIGLRPVIAYIAENTSGCV